MHHSITCDFPLVTSHPILPSACGHWAVLLMIRSHLEDGRDLLECRNHIINNIPENHCTEQQKICKKVKQCLLQLACHVWPTNDFGQVIIWSQNHTVEYTVSDFTNFFTKSPEPLNNARVFHCNKILGFQKGISLTYDSSRWICEPSLRSYSLSCQEYTEVCQSIVSCIEETLSVAVNDL